MKRQHKKYRSIDSDLAKLLARLRLNPKEGVDLGRGLRKVRLPISSKGRGKSGGVRVITHTVIIVQINACVTLLAIYDKSEKQNMNDAELRELLKKNELL